MKLEKNIIQKIFEVILKQPIFCDSGIYFTVLFIVIFRQSMIFSTLRHIAKEKTSGKLKMTKNVGKNRVNPLLESDKCRFCEYWYNWKPKSLQKIKNKKLTYKLYKISTYTGTNF